VDVRDRMDLLLTNGLQGLVLVFLVLAVFLELKLAFWVAIGIPDRRAGRRRDPVGHGPDSEHAVDVRLSCWCWESWSTMPS
jgi:hypothetical protein